MRVAVLTQGSTGDFLPFVALTRRLVTRGHDTRLFGHNLAEEHSLAQGIPYQRIGPPLDLETAADSVDRMLASRNSLAHARTAIRMLLVEGAAERYQDIRATLDEYDLAVCHSFDAVSIAAAEDAGLPWVSVVLCPALLPSLASAPPPLPSLGTGINRVLWRLMDGMLYRLGSEISVALADVSPRERRFRAGAHLSPHLTLVAASPALAPTPATTLADIVTTGAWAYTEPGFEMPEELAEFLDAPGRPVVVSFGSMLTRQAEPLARLLLEGLERGGQRAVVQRGFGGIEATTASKRVMFADYVPHEHLFPRASAVIHHCGAGTTHAACRAGVPSIPVPHLFDQGYWADRLYRLGVAAKPLGRRRLTPERLGHLIRGVVSRTALQERARSLGRELLMEDGVTRAVDTLERYFSG